MGTSYVEYKGFGFWTRDSFLASWLRVLIDEMQALPTLDLWQKSLMEHWHIQAGIDGGVMSVGLDKFLFDNARREFLLELARKALKRSVPLGQRTGELFVDLLEGRLKTTSTSPINYFGDP